MKILNTDTNKIETLTYTAGSCADHLGDITAADPGVVPVDNADYDATADQSTVDWWREIICKMEERDQLEADLKANHRYEADAVLEEMTQWHSGGDMEMSVENQSNYLGQALTDLENIKTGGLLHRGSSAPYWWDIIKHSRESTIMLESATMGSSPNNEWYAFRDRAAAVSQIRETFNRQAFVDNYTYLDETSEYYRTDDLDATEATEGEIVYTIPKGVKPASIAEMIACESRF